MSETTLPAIYCRECGRVHDPYNRTGDTECECGRDWDDLEICPDWLVDKELERLINKRHNTDLTAQLATVTAERDEARADLEDYKILFGDSSIVQLREQAAAVFGMNPSNENVLRTKVTQQEGEIQVVTAERDEARALLAEARKGNPIGPIVGAMTIVEQELQLRSLREAAERVVNVHLATMLIGDDSPLVQSIEALAAALGDTGGTGR